MVLQRNQEDMQKKIDTRGWFMLLWRLRSVVICHPSSSWRPSLKSEGPGTRCNDVPRQNMDFSTTHLFYLDLQQIGWWNPLLGREVGRRLSRAVISSVIISNSSPRFSTLIYFRLLALKYYVGDKIKFQTVSNQKTQVFLLMLIFFKSQALAKDHDFSRFFNLIPWVSNLEIMAPISNDPGIGLQVCSMKNTTPASPSMTLLKAFI